MRNISRKLRVRLFTLCKISTANLRILHSTYGTVRDVSSGKVGVQEGG